MADKSSLEKLILPSQSEVGLDKFFASLPLLLPILLVPVIWYFRYRRLEGPFEWCQLFNFSCQASPPEIVHAFASDIMALVVFYAIGSFALGLFLYTSCGGNFPQEKQGKSAMVNAGVAVGVFYILLNILTIAAVLLLPQLGIS